MIGARCIYDESGDRFVVAVVNDRSDAEATRYRLRVVRVLSRDARHAIRYGVGDEFEVMVSRVIPGADAYCPWTLTRESAGGA